MTIANSGNATLTVSSISYPAGFSGAWSGTIAAGGSQNVTVTFAPTALISYGGTVTVNSDATSGTSTISASGTGTSGLVAYWPLDEGAGSTTADTSGGGRTGTLTGGTSWTAGQVGSGAVAFDGVNGRLTFTALPLTTTFTVAMWVYPVPSSDSYGTLFAEGANKGIWYRGGSRKIEFYPASQASQTALTENQWHHVAVVCAAGNLTYYLDGVTDGTATGGIAFNADTMGDDPVSETFKGQMDEVRVYNRSLSAAQVAALSKQTGAPESIAARVEGGVRADARTVDEPPGSGNPPSLAIVKVTPEEVVVALRVDGRQSYIVQASADLVRWVPLTNVTTAGTHLFTDRSHSARCFYRLVPSSMTQ
jgi:hypothetical protein